jgi:hypothetical protein
MPELRASRAELSITGVEAVGINVEAFCFDSGAFDCIAAVPDTSDCAPIQLRRIADTTRRVYLKPVNLVGRINRRRHAPSALRSSRR